MKILKRIGTQIILPPIFAFVVLLMLVAVPIDSSQIMIGDKKDSDNQKNERVVTAQNDYPEGLEID